MGAREEQLIQELLHNVTASGNQVLERRLADLTVWFYKNKKQIDPLNLATRQAFLEKAFWIMLEVNALLADRIHDLESQKAGKSLFTIKGLSVSGDVRRFG